MTPFIEPQTKNTAAVRMPDRVRRAALFSFLAVGLLGGGLTLIEVLRDSHAQKQVLFSYLIAYLFGLTLCLGSLFFVLIQHVVGAVWSVSVRRIAETVAALLPLMAILFIPIALGAHHLFPWAADPNTLTGRALHLWHEAHEHKGAYLNMPFFLVRAACYFLVWTGLGVWQYRRSLHIDKTGDLRALKSLRKWSAPSLLVYGLSVAFAGFDWVMSLRPDWFSTMFGVYIFAGSVVSSLALITVIALWLRRQNLLRQAITVEHYHDLGKLLFGFTVFWAYIAFSQAFLIWYANLPEEISFYGARWFQLNADGSAFDAGKAPGPWAQVTKALAVLQFVVPFWMLLSRFAKRSLVLLGMAAVVALGAHYLDMYWLCMPELHPHAPVWHWFDGTALLGIIGFMGAALFFLLGRSALVPLKDPSLSASMEFENV